jgi:hypothetical protein
MSCVTYGRGFFSGDACINREGRAAVSNSLNPDPHLFKADEAEESMEWSLINDEFMAVRANLRRDPALWPLRAPGGRVIISEETPMAASGRQEGQFWWIPSRGMLLMFAFRRVDELW